MPYGTVNADIIQSSVSGVSLGAGNASIMKNRIINGAMVINQRAFSGSPNNEYTLDRWQAASSPTGKFTVSQNAGSVTTPAGFVNYLGCTSTSAYSSGSTDAMIVYQQIEGYNIADLAWGTASAKTITVSFQVYSSLTGTFGGSVANGAYNRFYPFSYSIPVANTWTTVSVTVAGDTTGTWATTNGSGLRLYFDIGSGSSFKGTAGSWGTTPYYGVTGGVSVTGTNGATWYLTGVQLEVGSSATGFEYRQYQQELALCQRYFRRTDSAGGYGEGSILAYTGGSVNIGINIAYPVTMRTAPTSVVNGTWNNQNSSTVATINAQTGYFAYISVTGSGQAASRTDATGYLTFSAEL